MATTLTKKIFVVVITLVVLYGITLLQLSENVDPPPKKHSAHKDLLETDEVIIVLGYKLHPDGMPTRILRNRVQKAVDVYQQLMAKNHHPLVVVSGKGKAAEADYTEAQAMEELALWLGVRKDDILVDHESTNTAQNAAFTASLIKNKPINEAIVVTSDYHMLRAQYTFQAVFPG